MNESQNSRVVGAFVLGIALVGASYVIANFGDRHTPSQPQPSRAENTTTRVAIKVTDDNNNGVEDWKESVSHTAPLRVPEQSGEGYVPPDTLSGQFSVEFYKTLLNARTTQPFGASDEEVVENAVGSLTDDAKDELYAREDFIVVPNSPAAYREYANAAGAIIIANNVEGVEEPTTALRRLAENGDEAAREDLAIQAQMYAVMRDQYLNLPVPKYFVPIHEAFVNAFHALHNDLTGFAAVQEDPLKALLRIKRYQDDAVALQEAINAMDTATEAVMETTSVVFTGDDPAAIFYVLQTRSE